MSRAAVGRVSDGERFAMALLLALLLHGGIVLLVPGSFLSPLPEFEPPLYVSFDPLPQPEEDAPVVPNVTPEQPEPVPEIASPETIVDSPSSDGNASAPVAPVESNSGGTRTVQTNTPTFVPDPAPPAPVRSIDPRTLQRNSSAPSSDFVEAELSRYYAFQEEWLAAQEAYQERVAASSDSGDSGDSGPAAPDVAPLEDQLRRVLEGIRSSANGDPRVVDLGSDRPATPGADSSDGDGSGIRIGDDRGGRYRLSAGELDLSDLRLPLGFPAEYPLSCGVRVNAEGVVVGARVEPPSPSQELNERVAGWVRSWRFETARTDQTVESTFTIIVRTR